MKYLALLLLVSCASNQPNCTVQESGVILGEHFTILQCKRPIACDENDTECQTNIACIQNDSSSYSCVRRD